MSLPLQPPERQQLESVLAEMRSELRANTEVTRRIEHLLTGNGNPHKGMIVRVDRLEQAEKRRGLWTKMAIGLAVTSLGVWIKQTFGGGH